MGQKVFVREATGLVKSMGTFDAFWVNMYAMNPILGAIFSFALGPALFPGGDLVIAAGIATVGTILLGASYAISTAAMPRSGGDYVFVSRTTHPLLGFFSSFNFMYWVFAFWGFNAFLAATFFGRLMGDAGLSSLASWVGTPTGNFVIGSIISILGGVVVLLGLRTYFRLQTIVVIIAGVATIMAIFILFSSAGMFHAKFNEWAVANSSVNGSDPYQTVINTAAAQGFSNPGFTWAATLGVVPIMWGAINTPMWATFISGEMKNARSLKRQLIAMAGSGALAGVVLMLLAGGLVNAAGGYTFFGSLASVGSSLGIPSSYDFYIRVLSPYIPFIDFAFFMAAIVLIPLDVMFTTRAMFAWSFDRIIPSRFASVSSRNGSPVFTTIVSVAVAEFMIFLFAFTSATSLYAVTTFGIMVTYMILVLSVALFPYLRKALFQSSDIKQVIGSAWKVTIVGLLAALFLVFMGYYYIAYPGLGGFSSLTLESVVVLFIASVVIYFVSKSYHSGKGIDIGMAFKEIPPE